MNEPGEATATSTLAGRGSRNRLLQSAQKGGGVVILALLAYYVFFRLPFRFPPEERLMSASYAFGFNNGVAIVGLAGLLGLVTLMLLLRERCDAELPIKINNVQSRNGWTTTKVSFAML